MSGEYRMLERGELLMVGDEFLMRGEWRPVIHPGGRKCGWIYPTARRPLPPKPLALPAREKNGEATYRVPVSLFPPLPIDRSEGPTA